MEPVKKIPHCGQIKNKQLTMGRLIDAVGEIIRTKGYTGLGVNKIAKQAGVDKVLIYRYFISPQKLIETYVMEKDYWLVFSEKLRQPATDEKGDLQEIATSMLENQFDFFLKEVEMQQLIIWEICEKGELMKKISLARESLASDFLEQTDKHFKRSQINFRVLSALLSAGIYYMILHKDVGEYCGIDLKKQVHQTELKRTVREIIAMVFDEKERKT
jgi:AcrR family transcriptional regulator